MKMTPPVVLVAGWLTMVPAMTFGAGQHGPATVAARAAAAEVATHATKGVVKSVSPTVLVIERSAAGKRTDTSFGLRANTQQAGVIAAGSRVEIRYRTEGGQRIATAVIGEAAAR